MKKLFAFLLCLILIFGMSITTTFAASDFLNLKNSSSDRSGIGWVWKADQKTLVVYNGTFSGIDLPDGATLQLAGYCQVSNMIYCYGNMSIMGSGILSCTHLNAYDGDGDLDIYDGYITARSITAGNMTVMAGSTQVQGDSSTALVNVYGQYLQSGGIMSVSNNTANAMNINGMGLEMTGGYLYVTSYVSNGLNNGSLWCSGNEIYNKGGVIIAKNYADGNAINNYTDYLTLGGGVTYACSTKGNAVGGKVIGMNGEKYWLGSVPKGDGLTIPSGGTLDGRYLVFAKAISAASAGTTTLDGVFLMTDKSSGTAFSSTSENIVVKGASLIYSSGNGMELNGTKEISGEGTLAVYSGKVGINWTNKSTKGVISLRHLVVDAIGGEALSYSNGTTAGALILQNTTAVLQRRGYVNPYACSASGGMYLQNSNLTLVNLGEYQDGAFSGLSLDCEMSNATIYSLKSSPLLLTKTANTYPSVSAKGGSVALVTKGGYPAISFQNEDKTPMTGRIGLYDGCYFAAVAPALTSAEFSKDAKLQLLSQSRDDSREVDISNKADARSNKLFAFPYGLVDVEPPAEEFEMLASASGTIKKPAAGEHPSYQITCSSPKYTASVSKWYAISTDGKSAMAMSSADTFEAGKTYWAEIEFTPAKGCRFVPVGESKGFSINGDSASYYAQNSATTAVYVTAYFKTDAAPLSVKKQPVSAVVKNHFEEVDFTVAVLGGREPYKYQWQSCSQGKWQNLKNDIEVCTGVSTDHLTIIADSSNWTTNEDIRCVITDADGKTVITSAVRANWTPAEKPVELTTPFVDVPKNAYYYDATVWAYNAEPQITDGNGKDKFMPEQICTRGQVVTFLWRAAGCPEPKSRKNPFTDVKSSDYFYKPVLWAVEQGITDGTSPDRFSPANPCKNSHILTFIWRALGEPDKTGQGTWYTDAYNWAVKNHLLDGTYTGTFDINAQCPRKNVVQYLYVYYTMAAE